MAFVIACFQPLENPRKISMRKTQIFSMGYQFKKLENSLKWPKNFYMSGSFLYVWVFNTDITGRFKTENVDCH